MKSVVNILQDRALLFKQLKNFTSHNSVDALQNNMKYEKQLVLLNQAKANLLGAQFELNDAMNIKNSNIMYDTFETSLIGENSKFLNIELIPYQEIENTAMEYSYSLVIAKSNIEKHKAEVTSAYHKRIPDVTIAGGYAYQTAHQTGSNSLSGAFVGANVNIPILYSYRPDIDKAKVVLERSKIEKDSYENHLKYALKEDYNNFKYAKENIQHYNSIVKDSKKILETYTHRYEKNQASLLNLIQVENAHRENLREYITAVRIYYDAYLNLMQNVGHDILLEENNL